MIENLTNRLIVMSLRLLLLLLQLFSLLLLPLLILGSDEQE